jgi:hypothetical protein
MKHQDAIYSREEISRDGLLRVCYNYSDGEKSPLVIEPCITMTATGEVLLDLWRSGWNGHVEKFGTDQIQLRVSDRNQLKKILVCIDVHARTFTVADHSSQPQPLSIFRDVLFLILVPAEERITTTPLRASFSLGSWLANLVGRK